jgi:hypothetical protein
MGNVGKVVFQQEFKVAGCTQKNKEARQMGEIVVGESEIESDLCHLGGGTM